VNKPPSSSRRLLRLAGWILGLALVWCGIIAGRIVYYGNHDEVAKADVIIILGAAVRKGEASPAFAGRIRHAIDLHKRGFAQKLIFTGGLGHDGKIPESEVGRQIALREGIDDRDILIESKSTKTWENFVEAARLMREHGLHNAIIVSDPYHLHRARTMAADAGITAVTSPTPHTAFRTWRTKVPFLLNELRLFHSHLIYRALDRR
jgi:uncharacterized SAM-binding protein YcdF (DUF218 family)